MGDGTLFKGGGESHPHGLAFSNKAKADFEVIASLMGLDDWKDAIDLGRYLGLEHAKAHVRGETQACYLTPEQAAILNDNEEFFDALCEDGMIEWLTPLVLRRKREGA